MHTHLFLKTWPRDFCWLIYCLQSIRKNLTGWSGITILTDPGSLHDLSLVVHAHLGDPGLPVHLDEYPNPSNVHGYLWQQAAKLEADLYCPPDTDYIAMLDSDCIVLPGTTVGQWFADQDDRGFRSIWRYTPYSVLGDSVPWKPITEDFLGEPVEHEFMRAHPHVIPVAAFSHLRDFCQAKHGMHIRDYIATCPRGAFSEFNALGAWIYRDMAAGGQWPVIFTEAPGPPPGVVQHWSWGGIDSPKKQQLLSQIG